jgi:hypothetical protein
MIHATELKVRPGEVSARELNPHKRLEGGGKGCFGPATAVWGLECICRLRGHQPLPPGRECRVPRASPVSQEVSSACRE